MCIRNILHGLRACLKTCVLVGTMIFVSGIMTAEASICFLPTGRCSQSVSTKVQNCKNWTSPERDEYCSKQSGYVKDEDVPTAIASGFSCVSAAKAKGDICCEGWSLCIQENCLEQGFKLTEKKDENYYICASCSQGGKTFYKCKAKPCNYDTDTSLPLNVECTNTNGLYCLKAHEKCVNGYEWVADATKKAGSQACGKCQAMNPPTPDNPEECLAGVYYWAEQVPHGCVVCSAVGNITGRTYYCCNYLEEYNIPENNRETSETSCKTYEGPVEASGYEVLVQHKTFNCYKEIEKTCGNKNQYLDQSLDGCYCRDYSYYLDATPTYLGYTAAGGNKNVSVTSTISTRTHTENYPYAVDTDHVQSCSISSSGNKVKVSCEPNPRTTPITASFNITQTPKVVTTTHKVLYKTISLKIDGDTCTPYQFSNKCSDACDVAEYRNQSVSGASPCYECVNDCCPTGYTKGSTPSPTEGYDTTTTEHGSNCYKTLPCKDGATTTNLRSEGKCYNCSEHGYTGPIQCWLCSHMDTSCDTANGYTWDEGSCKCIPAGCAEGDVSKQSVDDCGTSGDKGWIYESKGKSGGKNCGVCTKKNCTGETSNRAANGNYFECTSCFYGDVEKFTCTCPLTDALCGDGKSADTSTCTCKDCPETCASHGWVTSESLCHYGSDNKGTLCRATCYACRDCTDTCAKHGWTSSSSDCKFGHDVKQDDCGATCYACKACTDTCSAHGWKNSASDCSYGSDPQQNDCGTTCYACKACTPTTCSTSTYPYTSRDLSSTSNTEVCDPGCDGTKRYKCAGGYEFKSGKCAPKPSDTCADHGWVTSCTGGCSGNKLTTCTNMGTIGGSTCYEKSETTCTNGCSNGACNEAKTCSDYGYETSCSAGCTNSVKTTCTTKTPETGLTCYEKSTETCANGCDGNSCKGKVCSDGGYVDTCTAGCSNNIKTTCTQKSYEGLTCYEKGTETCTYGCDGNNCKAAYCSYYNYDSSCTPGCSNGVKTTCTTKNPVSGLTCYQKGTETCTYGCSGNNCASATCSYFNYDSSCTPGCSNGVKTTCTTKNPVSGLTCYEKNTETCANGCDGDSCKGKVCSDGGYVDTCTSGCSNSIKTTCTQKSYEGLTCYEKSTETCTYGCSGNNCKAAYCSYYDYDSSCTPGCSNSVKTTCTTKYPGDGLTCYEKSTETCTYGCSGSDCAAANCGYYGYDSSCTPGCNNGVKTTCTTKNPVSGLTCYEKSTETCTYGCDGNNCKAAYCSYYNYDSSCTPGCSNGVKTTCTTKYPGDGLTCYEKSTETCTYGCSGSNCAAANCGYYNYESSCTPGCSNGVKTTCTTKYPGDGLTCYEKNTETCTYGCSGSNCAAANCGYYNYESSCTPGCSNSVKTTCTTKYPGDGLTCYEKSTENCTYGCSGSNCCTPSTCSTTTYPYTTSDLYSSTDNTEPCNPGCGQTVRYKCKSGFELKNGQCQASCTPTDCSAYTITAKPSAGPSAGYSSCTPGCGDDTEKYKCNSGYYYHLQASTPNGDLYGCVLDACEVYGEKMNPSDLGCGSNYTAGGKAYSGKQCYKCTCDDTCPVSGESKTASSLSCSNGTEEGTPTGCGTTCYKCKSSSTTSCSKKPDCYNAPDQTCGDRWTACWQRVSAIYSWCKGKVSLGQATDGECDGYYSTYGYGTCDNYKNYECPTCVSSKCTHETAEPNWCTKVPDKLGFDAAHGGCSSTQGSNTSTQNCTFDAKITCTITSRSSVANDGCPNPTNQMQAGIFSCTVSGTSSTKVTYTNGNYSKSQSGLGTFTIQSCIYNNKPQGTFRIDNGSSPQCYPTGSSFTSTDSSTSTTTCQKGCS